MARPRPRAQRNTTVDVNIKASAPADQEKSRHFAAAKGSPFMVSGELFLRSTREQLFEDLGGLSQRQPLAAADPGKTDKATRRDISAIKHPSAGLLAGLSTELRDLLLCHPDLGADEATDRCLAAGERVPARTSACGTGLLGLVSSARRDRRSVRRERIEHLKTSKKMARCMARARLSAVQKAMEGFERRSVEARTRLETRLSSLILRFAAAMSAEMAREDARVAAEFDHCRRETERLQLAARLASLAATAEYRTRGSVVVRRLPPTHPQHARCLRAATENVRPGFFSGESPYSAVRVLDIYKIENRFLLERFQRAAETKEQCKVKGLFCHVPDDSLEYVVSHGMGAAGVREGDGSITADVGFDEYGFDWDGYPTDPASVPRSAGGSASVARRGRESGAGNNRIVLTNNGTTTTCEGARLGKPLEFPRSFSRYSTLEEEREYANRSGGESGTRDRSCPPAQGDSKASPDSRSPSGPSMSEEAGCEGGSSASGLRFLALCRVMIGSMYVSPSPSTHRTDADDARPRADAGVLSRTPPPAQTSRERRASITPLPSPPPGQAEFDSVYFPREEEYLLLKEAFVLPEFLVVHRFVSPPEIVSSSTARSYLPSPSSGTDSAAVDAGGGHAGAPGPRDTERPAGAGRGRQGVHNPLGPETPVASTAENASSVVARVEAAMKFFQPNLTRTPCSATPFPAWDGGITACSVSRSSPGALSLSGSNRSDGGISSESREQEQGNGHASRDSIVRGVELEFARFWEEVDRLRDIEKEEVTKLAGTSKVLKQPP